MFRQLTRRLANFTGNRKSWTKLSCASGSSFTTSSSSRFWRASTGWCVGAGMVGSWMVRSANASSPTQRSFCTAKKGDQEVRAGPGLEFKQPLPTKWGDDVVVLESRAITALFTKIRDVKTGSRDYVMYSNRLLRILAEEGMAHMRAARPVDVETPCGVYQGLEYPDPHQMCVVSVVRSGDILQERVCEIAHGISVGKVLVQRDESHPDKIPIYYYCKLPPDVSEKQVLLVDPMIGTGGSAKMAVKKLVEKGVVPENITFLNVVSCVEGIDALHSAYPGIKTVTLALDPVLNEHKYIAPGLGDFGDRYYST